MSVRKDEFGELANSFNLMAERIETLLTAERRLLQDVSHELRSPLARLEFAIELARTSANGDKAFDRIKKETERLGILVSELLQVTRAENDPASRNLSAIPLRDLLKGRYRQILRLNQKRAMSRSTWPSVDPLELSGDRELLRRAVEKSCATPSALLRRAEPSMSLCAVSTNHAIIAVRDYGPGVPEESLYQPV